MITKDKIIAIFCIIDELDKNFDEEMTKNILPVAGKKHRNRKASLSDSEIMTILLLFHFSTFRNFKHYYLFGIRRNMQQNFPDAVSYNPFVKLERQVFFKPFCLAGDNADDRNPKKWKVLTKDLYGKVFVNKGVHLPQGCLTVCLMMASSSFME